MNIRNPKRISDKVLNCEIEHHELGWIPYTSREDDEDTLIIYARILNGEAGEIELDETHQEDIIALLKRDACGDIDAAATECRMRYTSPNKEGTYTLKDAEVNRWIADGRPARFKKGTYPYIEREAFYTKLSTTEVANNIEMMANRWKILDPEIEGVSRGGKVAVKAANSEEEIRDICSQTVLALNEL
jgi:hypothetical protein